MAQEWAKAFYKSAKWIKCRNSYIKQRVQIDGGVCEECQEQQGYIVHHKVLLTHNNIDDPAVSLNHANMKYVCKECHDTYDGHGVGHRKEKPLCRFDESGQPISLREIDTRPPC